MPDKTALIEGISILEKRHYDNDDRKRRGLRGDISSVQIRRLHSSANIKHAKEEFTVNMFPIMCFKKIAKSPLSVNIDEGAMVDVTTHA